MRADSDRKIPHGDGGLAQRTLGNLGEAEILQQHIPRAI